MMSILGATPQDMEEILKALGYRGQEVQAAEVEAKLSGFDQVALGAKAASEAAAAAAASQPVAEAAAPSGDEAIVAEIATADGHRGKQRGGGFSDGPAEADPNSR